MWLGFINDISTGPPSDAWMASYDHDLILLQNESESEIFVLGLKPVFWWVSGIWNRIFRAAMWRRGEREVSIYDCFGLSPRSDQPLS